MTTPPAPLPTRWWWVRHAPVVCNDGRLYGQQDLPCDCGDAVGFGKLAAMLPKDAVWVVSHLQRTHQTARAIIAAGLNGPAAFPGPEVRMEADLAEQSFGDWQGRTYAELDAMRGEAFHRFWLAPASEVPPGGESFVDLIERTRRTIARLNETHAGRNIIAVTHGGTIRAALGIALGLTPEASLSFSVDNLSCSRLDHFGNDDTDRGHAWRVAWVNVRPR